MNHWHCDVCGKETNEEHYKDGYCRFCSNIAGNPMSNESWTCKKCGTQNIADWCIQCGTVPLYRKSDSLISEIEEVRYKNNINWMDILRIAFRYAPDEASTVMKKITENDSEINKLSQQLGESK